ncbi:NADH dehydrogenase [ubiquinone] 1 beta subcomplex subunit 11, mitochondrial-like [Lineus longissimus]|uniref:NADH dehydrogenase [ubiquinone] 1 beta subcomplex subunit 11, mitochondrial-like n=1 Tax=Lineus longissimus TaxID=88925 RepID=UPI002B4F0C6E
MASLLRFSCRQGRTLVQNFCHQNKYYQRIRTITTSKKNTDSATVTGPVEAKETWQTEVEKEVAEETKDWVSYGYSYTDRDEDEWGHHLLMFAGITIAMVGGSFVIAYMPDPNMRDWAHREAYLELARRERDGLPLVDPDYVPKDSIELPSDEELGNQEIII